MAENIIEHPIISKLLEQFSKKLEETFKDAVQREGLISSRELLDSIRAEGVKLGSNFISTQVNYSELLRIKDMRKLEYSTIPPLAPLEEWVERIGLNKFAYIPGYPQGVKPATESEQIHRIAKGIQYHLMASPNVTRAYKGIYNEPMKGRLLADFFNDMRAAVVAATKQNFYNSFGYEIHIDVPSGPVNASRIQAAMNAADTKLARKYANQDSKKS